MKYLTDVAHASFGDAIAEHGRDLLCQKLSNALAVSFLQDGSCDIQQQDNYFHGANYVCGDTGKIKSVFVDFQVKDIRGARGQVDCLERALFSILKHHPDAEDMEDYGPSDVLDLIDTFHQVALTDDEQYASLGLGGDEKKEVDGSDFYA